MADTIGDALSALFRPTKPAPGFNLQPFKPVQQSPAEQHWRRNLANQGGVSRPTPTVAGKVEQSLGAILGEVLSERNARRVAGKTAGILNDLTPVGDVTGADEGQRQFRRGLTQGDLKQAAIGAGIFGLSMVPFAAGAKRAGRNALMDLMTDESGAIRAWHGSPHDFDRFDMSKIGTGEGAQAYGHGLYFAENKAVADQYRTVLSNRSQATQDPASAAGFWLGMHGGDRGAAVKTFESIRAQNQRILDRVAQKLPVAPGAAGHALSEVRAADEALAHLAKGTEARTGGRLYEVNINAEPEDFLDWDAPLSGPIKQRIFGDAESERKALLAGIPELDGSIPHDEYMTRYGDALDRAAGLRPPELPGQAIYQQFGAPAQVSVPGMGVTHARGPEQAAASERLRRMGIPGLKYLDQRSRGLGDGTRNYVVFDDRLIDILNKY